MEKQEVEKIKWNQLKIKDINLKTIQGLYLQYREIINYLVFGGLTTIVNFFSYFVFTKMLGIEEVLSSAFAWFCSVLFAYITNKLFVFDSKTNTKKALIIECISFFAARILSGILCDVGTFAIMVKVMNINDIVAKIVTQIMVVIVNYIFSKSIVFRKRKERRK